MGLWQADGLNCTHYQRFHEVLCSELVAILASALPKYTTLVCLCSRMHSMQAPGCSCVRLMQPPNGKQSRRPPSRTQRYKVPTRRPATPCTACTTAPRRRSAAAGAHPTLRIQSQKISYTAAGYALHSVRCRAAATLSSCRCSSAPSTRSLSATASAVQIAPRCRSASPPAAITAACSSSSTCCACGPRPQVRRARARLTCVTQPLLPYLTHSSRSDRMCLHTAGTALLSRAPTVAAPARGPTACAQEPGHACMPVHQPSMQVSAQPCRMRATATPDERPSMRPLAFRRTVAHSARHQHHAGTAPSAWAAGYLPGCRPGVMR